MGTIVREYQGKKLVEHSGGPALAELCIFPQEGLAVIVLANQRGFYPYLSKTIASFYIKGIQPEGPPGR
jgi:D-alanyl-D-alanine carboxypeptidase